MTTATRARAVTLAEAAARAQEWNALAAELPVPSIFSTWEWFDTWWKHFGDDYQPRTLFIERGEELLGILPLAQKSVAWRRDGLLGRVLFLASSEELSPDHLDLISRPEVASICLLAIEDYLDQSDSAWDVLELQGLAAGGNLDQRLPKSRLAGLRTGLTRAPFLALTESFDDYQQRFSGKTRYNFVRALRQLEARGYAYTAIDPTKAEDFFSELFALHARRSDARGIHSTFQGERIARFHRELLRRSTNQGWQWNRSLSGPAGMVAGIYAFLFAGRIAYYQVAIDPEWDRFSPGTALMYSALREAMGMGAREFDFLRGEEDYKLRWTETSREVIRWRLFHSTPRGVLARVWSVGYNFARQMKRRRQNAGQYAKNNR